MIEMLEDPADFFKHIMRAAASMGTVMFFGHRGKQWEEFWASVGPSTVGDDHL